MTSLLALQAKYSYNENISVYVYMTKKNALQNAAGSILTNILEFYADKTWRGTSSYQIMCYEPNRLAPHCVLLDVSQA